MQLNKIEQLIAHDSNVYAFLPKSQSLSIKQNQKIAYKNQFARKKMQSSLCLLFVVLMHSIAIYYLVQNSNTPIHKAHQEKAMLVSLIAPPAIEPELKPLIKQVEKVVEPKVEPKPKKLAEKLIPIEMPAERMVEVATQQMVQEEQPTPQVQSVEQAQIKSPAKAEVAVEDKIELPRFGVAYLNNPAPDYPAMSRRAGEEGRVVMKVLVSAEGAADDVQIEKSSGSDRLDIAAVNAVKKWRFIPATKNNQPFSAYVLVPMKFSLDS